MSNRIARVPTVSGVELHITAKKQWFNLIFYPIWLVGWTFGGIMAIRVLLWPGPSTPRLFFLIWLVGWAMGEIWVTYQWLWTAFGKEIVKVSEGELTIKRDILGRGRSRAFPIGSVANLRAAGFFPSSSYWSNYLAFANQGIAGGTVAFDCQGKIQRFGVQLEEPEAQQVVAELKPYLS
jgi:hypothetical protein